MCGIAGCITNTLELNRDKFEKMVDIIAYRGPDDRGTFYEDDLALGHRRLSIVDLSSDGHQPFFYKDRYVIVFNGEIYNYQELREELRQQGYVFRTKTDTEVLVAAYDFWGEDCVTRMNGMWSFAIYDRMEKKIFCSRDRFGVKPFYYTEQNGMFLFASEIKQFFEMLESRPRANKDCLLQFIIRGSLDYSSETMFQDIYQLLGGHNLVYDLKEKTYRVYEYHNIRDVLPAKLSYDEACKEFHKYFMDSISFRLRADVPVGYCLSGGLDSSSIVCAADKLCKENGQRVEQHTISSCFEDKRYDEQEYIDEVVAHTSVIPHKIFPQETNLFEQLDDIIWHMDEPFGSTSIYAQWNVFKGAKEQGLKVMLDGQGADEQLAGYSAFYKVLFTSLIRSGKFKAFRKEWDAYKALRAKTEKHVSTKDMLLSTMGAVLLPDKNKFLLKWVYYNIPGNQQPFSWKQLKKALKTERVYPVRDPKEYIACSIYMGMSSLLHYEDRDSMAHSIESRVPFLDVELAEFVYSLPFEYRLHGGITKSVLRDGLADILPEKIRNRYSKLGFVTPEDQWINNNFEKYGIELRKAAHRLGGVLDEERVLNWFDKKQGKIKRQDFTAWRIICAGHWADVFDVVID